MRPTLWLALVVPCFTLGACDGCGPIDPVGSWDFTWTVEEATGGCAGEVGEKSTGVIEIKAGDEANAFELTGFGTDEDGVLEGTFENNTLTYEGSYADDGGTTVANTTLELSDDGDTLTGSEDWSWGNEAVPDSCPSATSSVSATRRD